MDIGFLGEFGFQRNEKDSTCMMFSIRGTTMGNPVDFYFTGENEFTLFAYEWCKQYKKEDPGTHLVYVTDENISKKDLKEKKKQYDWVIVLQGVN